MIVSIESSIPTFKTLRFHAGLNILLSDRSAESTNRQTRNSAGKTSFLEIVHFLMGANCDKKSLFRTPALVQATFIGTFKIAGVEFKVARSGSEPSKIWLLKGSSRDLATKIDKDSEREYASNESWKQFLGYKMFNLPIRAEGTAFDQPHSPTFRSLFGYFARRHNSGGLVHPERNVGMQQRSEWQVNLSYLLDLDWELPQGFQRVRDREKTIEELKRATRDGALGSIVGTVAELRPQVTTAEAKANQLRDQLSNFEVLDSYKDLSQRAARTQSEMQAIARETIILKQTLEYLQRALAEERAPQREDLAEMYKSAGIELPGVALRRFEDVAKFHASVVSNRRRHLQSEIEDTGGRIGQAEGVLKRLDDERKEIFQNLRGRGALEDFLNLQRRLAELEANAASLKERYKAAGLLEGEATQLDLDRTNLKRRLQEDHERRSAVLQEAILSVSDTIASLYKDRNGGFVVEATDNGPDFRIYIDGDRGGGIASMEVFCLDLALFKIVHQRFSGPGFLIHDSHLFDGVDERQIKTALELGSALAGEDRQYIVTMNSDVFNSLDRPLEFEEDATLMKTRLSDATDTGGLFGFWFQ